MRRASGSGKVTAGGTLSRAATVWIPSVITALAFGLLYHFDLVGRVRLPVLLTLVAIGAVSDEVSNRKLRAGVGSVGLHACIALQLLVVTAIIYAIGWGPTLAVGYAFVAARALDEIGSKVWRPMLVWSLVGMTLGQCAVAAGLVTSYVKTPYVHGLGALSGLGMAFVIWMLGSKTEQNERAQAALETGMASFRQLFADNPQPMWVFDAETLAFLEVNEAAVRHYGYSRDEFLALTLRQIRPAGDGDRLRALLASRSEGVEASGGWRHVLKGGREIEVEIRAHTLQFNDRAAVLCSVQDVTARNELEAELRHQAFHDSLTNLANRALFEDRVDHAIHRHARDNRLAAVLLLDLDRFKMVNDSLGHSTGDRLLVDVAARLTTALRPGDTIARLGGDEFAVLIEDLESSEAAVAAADRVTEVLEAPFALGGKEVFVHASVGVTLAGIDGGDAEALIRNADAAMYRAKKAGGSCHRRFEPDMHAAALARFELEADLRRALANDEFVVYYQPILTIDGRRVVSLEALVRWQHPTRGLVAPMDFIPLAEETGLIVELGRLVLHKACLQAKQWRDAGHLDFTMAVNLSRRQLTDPELVDDVVATIAAAGLEPSVLVLEVTESVLLDDAGLAIARLHQLKAAGVRLAIDDFGTGYSSLSSLRDLPVDELKIDKSFIDGIATGADAAGVVQAIIRLARTLNLDTVAEGVEDDDQLHELHALGCGRVQGFRFSKPLPGDQAGELFDEPVSSIGHLDRPDAAGDDEQERRAS